MAWVALPLALGILLQDRFELSMLALGGVCAAIVGLRAIASLGRARGPCRLRGPGTRGTRVCGRMGEMGLGVCLGAGLIATPLFAPVPEVGSAAVAFRVADVPRSMGDSCLATIEVLGPRPGLASVLDAEVCSWLPDEVRVARLGLERPRARRNPGGPDARRVARRRGVHRNARLLDRLSVRLPAETSVRAQIEATRRKIGDAIDPPSAPSHSGAVLRGLVTGSRASIGPELQQVFVRTGTAHLLAISGLHVSWVFWLGQAAARAGLRRSRRLPVLRAARHAAVAIGVGAAAAYIALAGMGVPGLRAWVMAAISCVAIALGRPSLGWNGLAVAAVIILVAGPEELFAAGFWLSFVAVVGLLVWQPPPSGLRAALHTSVAAGLATAPGLAALGIPLAIVAPLANLVAVPWFGGLVLPLGFAAAAFGWVPLVGPALAALAHSAAAIGIVILEEIPAGSEIWLAPELVCGLALCAFSARLLVLGLRRPSIALASCALVALAISPRLGQRSDVGPRSFEVTILDVGQGDAIALRGADDRAWLVDAGPAFGAFDAGRSVVVPALRALGVERLEALVVTHADRDHLGGALAVLTRVPVRELWISRASYADPALAAVRQEAARRAVRIRLLASGQRYRLGEAELRVAWPRVDLDPQRRNDASIVVWVRSGDACIVLPGDVPAQVERALAPGARPCAVLKLAHHGSQTSSADAWLDAIRPAVAVVSASRRERAPLPHPAVRARLEARGIEIYETSRVGAVTLRLERGLDEVRVSSFICREAGPRCPAAE